MEGKYITECDSERTCGYNHLTEGSIGKRRDRGTYIKRRGWNELQHWRQGAGKGGPASPPYAPPRRHWPTGTIRTAGGRWPRVHPPVNTVRLTRTRRHSGCSGAHSPTLRAQPEPLHPSTGPRLPVSFGLLWLPLSGDFEVVVGGGGEAADGPRWGGDRTRDGALVQGAYSLHLEAILSVKREPGKPASHAQAVEAAQGRPGDRNSLECTVDATRGRRGPALWSSAERVSGAETEAGAPKETAGSRYAPGPHRPSTFNRRNGTARNSQSHGKSVRELSTVVG